MRCSGRIYLLCTRWRQPRSPDGGDSDTVPSGKAGLGVVTDALVYMVKSPLGSGDDSVDRGYGAGRFEV